MNAGPPSGAPAGAVCFLGITRFDVPLDETKRKKWEILSRDRPVYVIAYSQSFRWEVLRSPCTFFLLPYLPTLLLRTLGLFPIRVSLGVWLCLRRDVRVLIAQSPFEAVPCRAVKALAALLGRDVKVIVESHGDYTESYFLQRRVFWAKLARPALNLWARFGIRGADMLRAVSNSTEAQLRAASPLKPVHRFPAWTDIDPFFDAFRRESDLPRVVFAGVLTPVKGATYLIEAFASVAASFPQATLHLAGPESDASYRAALGRLAKSLGQEKRVRFHGALTQRQLAELFASAWVSVLPSLSEGLPRVVIESMAAGTPVIASRVGGIPELIDDGRTGWLVPAGGAPALAEKIVWMLSHHDARRRMGHLARSRAAALFSTKSYVESYGRLLASAGA